MKHILYLVFCEFVGVEASLLILVTVSTFTRESALNRAGAGQYNFPEKFYVPVHLVSCVTVVVVVVRELANGFRGVFGVVGALSPTRVPHPSFKRSCPVSTLSEL